MKDASVVIDVSDSPSSEDAAVMNFFRASTHNLLTAGAAAGVTHHVALSVVGIDRRLGSGYARAKLAQDKLIKESAIPVFDHPSHPVLRIPAGHRRRRHASQRISCAVRAHPADCRR